MNCTLYAAAKVLGIETTDLANRIGHDGTEIIWPHYHDCRKHRGYSIAEVQEVALSLGYCFVPLWPYPLVAPSNHDLPAEIWSEEHALLRLTRHMQYVRALMVGTVDSGIGHALAVIGGDVFDVRLDKPSKDYPPDFALQEAYVVSRYDPIM